MNGKSSVDKLISNNVKEYFDLKNGQTVKMNGNHCFNMTELNITSYLTGELCESGDWSYNVNYVLSETIINICILIILLITFVAVIINKYTFAWCIKNISPFILLFFPFGWIAFHINGLETAKISYTNYGNGEYNNYLEIFTDYFNKYAIYITKLIYHIIELAVRILISKKLLAWVTGSLSILGGIKIGISNVGKNDVNSDSGLFWKKLAHIMSFAQLPIFLLVLGILYQIVTSWQIILIIFSIILSRIVSYYNNKVSILTDTITCVFAVWYAFVCKEYLLSKYHFDIDIFSIGINFALSFMLNYILTIKTFENSLNKIKDKKDETPFSPFIEIPPICENKV